MPGGIVGAWIVTLFPLAWAAIGSYFVLIPATISVAGIDRTTYIVTQFVALAVIFLLTVVFYIWGHAEKLNQDVVVELDLNSSSETLLSAGAGD